MTRAAKLAATILVVACATSPCALGDEAKDVLKKLQGAWVFKDAQGEESRWVFDGDVLRTTTDGNEYVSTVILNPKAKPVTTVDFKITQAPDDSIGKTALGIYHLEGDRLKLCVSMPGRDTRPTEFKQVEEETMVFELKRGN